MNAIMAIQNSSRDSARERQSLHRSLLDEFAANQAQISAFMFNLGRLLETDGREKTLATGNELLAMNLTLRERIKEAGVPVVRM